MIYTAKIIGYDGHALTVVPDNEITKDLLDKQVEKIEIRLTDGREITAEQRKKVYALIKDIAKWSGHEPEYIKQFMKFTFCEEQKVESFSLSSVDMTTASKFIDFLVDFVLKWNIPTTKSLVKEAENLRKYFYACLYYKKCAVCNAPADVHHIDTVGMGRDREEIIHKGMNAIALCRKHHNMAHSEGRKFFEKYHLEGIKLDDTLCKRLDLRSE